ncbi:hypothetical protein BC939DRAFT_491248, partial [Gamsiella multidivaricata]|uniref:uncharacterized protein n=1 Tax=Gamsiella multidivaricata TaxID=101098 RepID=UPI00221F7005
MKFALKTFLVVGISCLQQLAFAQTTTTTAAGGSVPQFQNTPGVVVQTPYNGMTVSQGTFMSISAILSPSRPIGSVSVSVAKTDGSANTTVIDIKGVGIQRFLQFWDVNTELFPIGEYYLNMVITPNTTASVSPTLPTTTLVANGSTSIQAVVTTTSATVPAPTAPATGTQSVYYWRGLIRVIEPRSKTSTSAAALGHSAGAVYKGGLEILHKMGVAL